MEDENFFISDESLLNGLKVLIREVLGDEVASCFDEGSALKDLVIEAKALFKRVDGGYEVNADSVSKLLQGVPNLMFTEALTTLVKAGELEVGADENGEFVFRSKD